MSIEHEPTIKRYEELRSDILAAIANLQEFAESLPEPQYDQLPLHYDQIGSLEDLRGHLREGCAPTRINKERMRLPKGRPDS